MNDRLGKFYGLWKKDCICSGLFRLDASRSSRSSKDLYMPRDKRS